MWAWLVLICIHTSLQQTCPLDTQNYSLYQSSCPQPQCTTCLHQSLIAAHMNCTSSTCQYLTNLQPFHRACKLSSFYTSLPFYQPTGAGGRIWYPAKRIIPGGGYEYVAMGHLYGLTVQDQVTWSEDLFDKDCLVMDNGQLEAEDCWEFNRHNCTVPLAEVKDFCEFSYCKGQVTCVTAPSECEGKSDRCQNCVATTFTCSAELVLTFKACLLLTVYKPECTYGGGNETFIYCFTNAVNMRTRVGLRLVQTQPAYNVYKVSIEDLIGDYWCESRAADDLQVKFTSNKALAFKKKYGYDFAALMSIKNICTYTNCNTANVDFNLTIITHLIEEDDFAKLRPMEVVKFDQSNSLVLYHISTWSLVPGIMSDFYRTRRLLTSLPEDFTLLALRSSKHCLPEQYQNLTWPLTQESRRVPVELCVKDDGTPVTRLCEGGFLYGRNWGDVDGQCGDFEFGENTLKLQSMRDTDVFDDGVLLNTSHIVRTGNLTLLDMYLVSQLLERTAGSNITTLNVSLTVIDALMQSDVGLLTAAQDRMNITDSYLRVAEFLSLKSSTSVHKDFVIVHSYDPQDNAGFALYGDLSIRPINNFSDLTNIDSVLLALYVTEPDLSLISNLTVTAVIYLNDHLFPSNTTHRADIVVNLNIREYDLLQSPLPILVKSDYNNQYNCAFWDYGTPDEPIRGNWSQSGSQWGGFYLNTSLQMCSYTHLTHLALLVIDDRNDTSILGVNDTILSAITAVGSLLSLAGITGIFITSCMFRTWRDKLGTQILLHLTVATLFEICFMYLNGLDVFDCVVAGVVIQYVIISKFAWMLIYAYCQYLRFVQVFGPIPRRLLLKSVLFGWGFALIPSLAVVITNPQTYFRDNFCYPKGWYLFLGFYLPVLTILLVNLWVFCKIMMEVTGKKLERVQYRHLRQQHFRLAVLLFSVLGIPWLFGIIANFVPNQWVRTIIIYLFTIMSIIQGFLMFLFYVIFNKETRQAWKGVLMGKTGIYEMFNSSSSTTKRNVSSISQ